MKEFFDAVDDIPNKNLGGCLFFCLVFWKWLKANGVPTDTFQIVQYEFDGNLAITRNMLWLSGCESDATSSDHFTWLYEGVEYDAEGVYTGIEPDAIRQVLYGLNTPHTCLVEEFCENALENGVWNDIFEREAAIDIVRERLKLGI